MKILVTKVENLRNLIETFKLTIPGEVYVCNDLKAATELYFKNINNGNCQEVEVKSFNEVEEFLRNGKIIILIY